MKIGNNMIKLLQLTVGQHNDKLRQEHAARVATAEAAVLKKHSTELTRRQEIKQQLDRLNKEVQKIESDLAKKGIGFQYTRKNENAPYLADHKSAGVSLPKPAFKEVDRILVELAQATEAEGIKILAAHGIVL